MCLPLAVFGRKLIEQKHRISNNILQSKRQCVTLLLKQKITQHWIKIHCVLVTNSTTFYTMSACDQQIDETSRLVVNTSPEDIDRMAVGSIKVYKRRWYILMIFTLLNATGNILWNTWPPVQETCQLVFGWDKKNVLIIGALQALGSIISIVPSAWLLDTKGELFIMLILIFPL